MRRFSFYTRGKTFYVRFWDEETKSYTPGMSTRETSEKAAYAAVYHYEKHGELPGRAGDIEDRVTVHRIIKQMRSADLDPSDAERIVEVLKDRGLIVSAVLPGDRDAGPVGEYLTRSLADFLEWFWNYDGSPYVQNKLRHGHSMTREHCENRRRNVRVHWKPWIEKHPVTLAETTRATLDAFSAHLAEKDISPQTRNHVLTAATAALSYAHDVKAIPDNPADGITFYSVKHAKRGTLAADEIRRLFALDWTSEAAKLASLTAATTGLRAGEIAALTVDDIADDRLHVRHSWSRRDGLKSTKTNEERAVPLIPAVRDRLREYAAKNPHGGSYVFWSADRDRPLSQRRFYDGLRDALAMLEGMTADEIRAAHRYDWRRRENRDPEPGDDIAAGRFREIMDEWQARAVSFHSWRHHYTATMAGIVDRRAMVATGHRTAAVFETYAAHTDAETFREVSDAATLAFSNVLTFPGAVPEDPATGTAEAAT